MSQKQELKPEQSQKLGGRTVTPIGDMVIRLREKRCWTVAQLADAAICSEKTIQRVEKSLGVFKLTIVKIAKAFNVEPSQLIEGQVESEAPVVINNAKPLHVTFVINMDFSQFDEGADLLHLLSTLMARIPSQGQITVQDVRKSSVAVDMTYYDASDIRNLVRQFCQHSLSDLGISKLTVPDYPGIAGDIASSVAASSWYRAKAYSAEYYPDALDAADIEARLTHPEIRAFAVDSSKSSFDDWFWDGVTKFHVWQDAGDRGVWHLEIDADTIFWGYHTDSGTYDAEIFPIEAPPALWSNAKTFCGAPEPEADDKKEKDGKK